MADPPPFTVDLRSSASPRARVATLGAAELVIRIAGLDGAVRTVIQADGTATPPAACPRHLRERLGAALSPKPVKLELWAESRRLLRQTFYPAEIIRLTVRGGPAPGRALLLTYDGHKRGAWRCQLQPTA